MGIIEAVCTSKGKGEQKSPVPFAECLENMGIAGDAHAGKWHRQLSLLAGESVDRIKLLLPELAAGAFAENIVTRGIDLGELKIGQQLCIGNAVILQVTQIGKECHAACAIREKAGDCIMPREGIFARVIQGGMIRPGDIIYLH
jgi:MOSC domain-containing protein YiiM